MVNEPMRSGGELFPSTERGRLVAMLACDPDARKAAVRRVLERYAEPLRLYVRGSSLKSHGDAIDLVQGFLASRLSRERYLDDWVESGLQLRRWLINGLHLYAKEEQRKSRPAAEASGGDPPAGRVQAAEAAWARALLSEACERVMDELAQSGHGVAWDIFRRHFIDGRPYRDLQAEFNMRPAAMAEASRRVSNLLREHVRLLLVRDGVRPEDIEVELLEMLHALNGSEHG
ncbi:MAG: hypothetical protein ACK5WD_02895 [bacterium]|jgi:hypothetical protein